MAGLNGLISDTSTTSTTMPSWYDTAQQKIVSDASNAAGTAPSLTGTVANTAINNLSNPNTNPFTIAQKDLSSIASGAINPWLTDPTTGQVTPNTNTAMGGLFAAQNQQLHGLIPQTAAPANAGAVAGGQFGSLRGDTAADTALTNAQNTLTAQQMQAALQNQQTGVSAANDLSNVGSVGTATETTLGKAQQSDPFTNSFNLAKVLASINAPTTTTNATQLSPLSQLGALSGALGMSPTDIANAIGSGSKSILDKIFGSSGSTTDNTNADGSNTYGGVPTYPTGDIGTVNNSSGTGNIGGMGSGSTNDIYNGSYGGISTDQGLGIYSRGGLVGISNLY